mgnify:CR=1 FL=1
MKKIDILSIGDLVIDAFIKLEDASVNCDINKQDCKLCVRFGDKVPYESVEICTAVGNGPNASVSAARLGLSSALFSYVGDDDNGKSCLKELQKNKVDTRYVHTEEGKTTNYHYVLWYDVDRTILIKHEEFSYDLGKIDKPKWIYLTSLSQHSAEFHTHIEDYLEKNPDVKLAFQPGTFQMKMGTKALERIYKNTEIFFCNVEEAQRILGIESRDLPTLLRAISKLGPKIVAISDGYAGAYAYNTRSGNSWMIPIYPHTPFERTGAGDAFGSTIVSALALGKPLEEALMWGPINSMSVVLQVGAQKGLLSREKLEEYLKNAPESYKLEKF